MNSEEFSKQTQAEAKEILDQTNLVQILSKYGEVRIGGSFYTELMYGPDIDINVATENPRESAVSFLTEVISKKLFQKYQYGDFENFIREKRPRDHIVVLILPFKNRKWEIEIWFSRLHSANLIEFEKKLKSLPTEAKFKILDLKERREKSGVSKHELSSFDIYEDFCREENGEKGRLYELWEKQKN